MSYHSVIAGVLDSQYPNSSTTTTINISRLNLKFIPLQTQPLLEQYSRLTTLAITKCHLRNLENFPRIATLTQLDLSHNELLGTLRFLMPLLQLTYLDLSNNMIQQEK